MQMEMQLLTNEHCHCRCALATACHQAAALQSVDNSTLALQSNASCDGKLFPSTGNPLHLTSDRKHKIGASPAVFARIDGYNPRTLTSPLRVTLRHTALEFDLELLSGTLTFWMAMEPGGEKGAT
ncbi:Putative G-protein coupled receptor 125 [Heterocephalus glaber]|uniref:Putative G-protein coupled receptor 125 n=1 Tax=Heterocephalus glaber TaxID=10181 RepID=G5AVB8_HETGA|nr:Putative G-protein coupled receptor 125 [Heterocephalus glaber]